MPLPLWHSSPPGTRADERADESDMSELDDLPLRKAGLETQKQPFLRRQWVHFALSGWFVLSLYPVVSFLMTGSSHASTVRYTQSQQTNLDRAKRLYESNTLQNIFNPSNYHSSAPSPLTALREPVIDFRDAFENFTKTPECTMSSLELHRPFAPLCPDRASLMTAMSGGGRIGIDAPYQPRDCDMRWFTPSEICDILGRFGRVSILGDSMMRNMAAAMFTLMRADLVNGGRANWVDDPEGIDCKCQGAFKHHQCDFHSALSTQLVWTFAPDSMICPQSAGYVEYTPLLAYPLAQDHVANWLALYEPTKPQKPHAFVMGHGLWNNIQANETFAWVEQVEDALKSRVAYLAEQNAYFPRLFITPSAAGEEKPDGFIERQGNIALSRFEHAVGPWVIERGYDHLGSFNLTIQAYNTDGTHAGMKNNLIKAMMVFNWLNALDTSTFYKA